MKFKMNTIFICIIFLLLGILLASLIFPNKCKEGMNLNKISGTACQSLLAGDGLLPLNGPACHQQLTNALNTPALRRNLCTQSDLLGNDQIQTLYDNARRTWPDGDQIPIETLNNCNSSGTDAEVVDNDAQPNEEVVNNDAQLNEEAISYIFGHAAGQREWAQDITNTCFAGVDSSAVSSGDSTEITKSGDCDRAIRHYLETNYKLNPNKCKIARWAEANAIQSSYTDSGPIVLNKGGTSCGSDGCPLDDCNDILNE